jgi:hypothetical protein
MQLEISLPLISISVHARKSVVLVYPTAPLVMDGFIAIKMIS